MDFSKADTPERSIMNYQTFLDTVVTQVSTSLCNGQHVTLQSIVKNNGMIYDGLIITDPVFNIAPTIYLNPYYNRFLDGISIDEICEEILDVYYRNLPTEDFDTSSFRSFQQAKSQITFKLINKEKNNRLLQDVPYVEFQDLVLVFVFVLTEFQENFATILIHNQHLSLWNITKENLYAIAMKNTPKLLPYQLDGMEKVLGIDAQEDVSMYVLTNQFKIYGSACMVYPNLLKDIAKRLQDDLIIIPSSIHEVLIIPKFALESDYSVNEVSDMITDINETELAEDEILSDHAYFYEKETDILSY